MLLTLPMMRTPRGRSGRECRRFHRARRTAPGRCARPYQCWGSWISGKRRTPRCSATDRRLRQCPGRCVCPWPPASGFSARPFRSCSPSFRYFRGEPGYIRVEKAELRLARKAFGFGSCAGLLQCSHSRASGKPCGKRPGRVCGTATPGVRQHYNTIRGRTARKIYKFVRIYKRITRNATK